MNVAGLKRDPDKIKASLYYTEDGKLITKTGCKIILPSSYVEKGLIVIGKRTDIVGCYAMVVGDEFIATSIVPSMMPISPDANQEITIDEDKFIVFQFDKGSVICPNVNLVRRDIFVYEIYKEFYSGGKVPFYFTELDVGRLTRQTQLYNGLTLAETDAPMDLVSAYITRLDSNPKEFLRNHLKGPLDSDSNPKPTYVPLTSVAFGAQDVTAMISGAYLDEGITTALITDVKEISPMEEIYRT